MTTIAARRVAAAGWVAALTLLWFVCVLGWWSDAPAAPAEPGGCQEHSGPSAVAAMRWYRLRSLFVPARTR